MEFKVENIIAGKSNINNRIYTQELIENDIINAPFVKEALEQNSLFIELDVNEEVERRTEIDVMNICGKINKIYLKENELFVDAEPILDLPFGQVFAKTIDNVKIYLLGSGDLEYTEEGDKVINYTFSKFVAR